MESITCRWPFPFLVDTPPMDPNNVVAIVTVVVVALAAADPLQSRTDGGLAGD